MPPGLHAAGMFARLLLLSLLVLPSIAAETVDQTQARRLEALVAALTDARKGIHRPAMAGLVAMGTVVLPDLQVLSGDPDPGIRARVALTASRIGGPETLPLLRRLSQDRTDLVREVAILGLGRTRSREAYALLQPFLQDPTPEIRDSAALALGQLGDLRAIEDLTLWPAAGGAQANLVLEAYPQGERQLKRIRKSMQASLKALVLRHDAIPVVARLLPTLSADRQETLLETTWQIGDPRLCPALVPLLENPLPAVRSSAALSLAANGDSRAMEVLCAVAAGDVDHQVREAAGETLRMLTGHRAAAGPAWVLWWDAHADQVADAIPRDIFIASLHDPTRPVDRADLQAWTPEDLMPLVDGVIGRGAPWWPALAWRYLKQDDAARWTPVLVERYRASRNQRERVAMVVLLDELDEPSSRPVLEEWLAAERARNEAGIERRRGSLCAALVLAVEGVPEKRLLNARQ